MGGLTGLRDAGRQFHFETLFQFTPDDETAGVRVATGFAFERQEHGVSIFRVRTDVRRREIRVMDSAVIAPENVSDSAFRVQVKARFNFDIVSRDEAGESEIVRDARVARKVIERGDFAFLVSDVRFELRGSLAAAVEHERPA